MLFILKDMIWNGHKLFERQIKPARTLSKQRSLLLYWSTGSGKTFAATFAIDALTRSQPNQTPPLTIIIAPAKVVVEVWKPTISKLKLTNRFIFLSYELARSRLSGIITDINKSKQIGTGLIVICDEVHNIRNVNTKNFHATFSIASKADKLILLSGTPLVNSVDDAVAIARLLKNDARIFFKERNFIDQDTLQIVNVNNFAKYFRGLVDSYLSETNPEDYPSQEHYIMKVNMYPLQRARYFDFVAELLTPALRRMMEEGIISNALNPFLVRTRSISNTVGKYRHTDEEDTYRDSEKFIGILKSIRNDPKPIVVYSYFLSNGVLPLKSLVDELMPDIRTALITGQTNDKDDKETLDNYNSDQVDVLFITSAVRHGVTLLKTRVLHRMEPSWNESTDEQIDGRAVRYKSHASLPPKERNIKIYSWITKTSQKVSTDEYIYSLSVRKQQTINVFLRVLIDS